MALLMDYLESRFLNKSRLKQKKKMAAIMMAEEKEGTLNLMINDDADADDEEKKKAKEFVRLAPAIKEIKFTTF